MTTRKRDEPAKDGHRGQPSGSDRDSRLRDAISRVAVSHGDPTCPLLRLGERHVLTPEESAAIGDHVGLIMSEAKLRTPRGMSNQQHAHMLTQTACLAAAVKAVRSYNPNLGLSLKLYMCVLIRREVQNYWSSPSRFVEAETLTDFTVGADLSFVGTRPGHETEPPAQAGMTETVAAVRMLLDRYREVNQKAARVVELLFGLATDADGMRLDPMTKAEVGRVLGVTRQRVQQIQKKAYVSLGRMAAEAGLEDLISDW